MGKSIEVTVLESFSEADQKHIETYFEKSMLVGIGIPAVAGTVGLMADLFSSYQGYGMFGTAGVVIGFWPGY